MIRIIYTIIMAELFEGSKSEVHYNKPRHFICNSEGYGVKPNSHADNLKALCGPSEISYSFDTTSPE